METQHRRECGGPGRAGQGGGRGGDHLDADEAKDDGDRRLDVPCDQRTKSIVIVRRRHVRGGE
jgi:hypothetical protein